MNNAELIASILMGKEGIFFIYSTGLITFKDISSTEILIEYGGRIHNLFVFHNIEQTRRINEGDIVTLRVPTYSYDKYVGSIIKFHGGNDMRYFVKKCFDKKIILEPILWRN